jgi:hypothetical protein
MKRFQIVRSALVLPTVLAAMAFLGTDSARAQGGVAFQRTVYSAKFLCGQYQPSGVCLATGVNCVTDADCPAGDTCDTREGPVKPGNYETAINVVNPTQFPLVFVKKAVLLFNADPANPVPTPGTFEEPQPPGVLISAQLPANWGLEIDCPDIRQVLLGIPPPSPPTGDPSFFMKGFVVIETFVAGELLDIVAAYTSHGFTPLVENICSLPGSPLDGQPCDPADATDPCLAAMGVCGPRVVGIVEEGFSVDVEKVEGRVIP